MFELIAGKMSDPHTLASVIAALAVGATVFTLVSPFFGGDTLGRRMKQVSTEREKIRAREREKLAKGNKASLRSEAKPFMQRIVQGFNAGKWLGTDTAKQKLALAGYRGQNAEVTFLFFRLIMPIVLFVVAVFYLFVVAPFNLSVGYKLCICIAAAFVGIKAPEMSLSNTTAKRQKSIRMAFPDMLDLMLICVESGMSLEHAGRKVAQEVGAQSVPLAEELTLTMAEMSYLPDRRQAFENFANRTGLELVKSLSTVLIQAERYGTPLGSALRVLSQEGRDHRMMEAEKKAAGLPPKLTVPMILFFLPVLFFVVGTPAAIQIMAVK